MYTRTVDGGRGGWVGGCTDGTDSNTQEQLEGITCIRTNFLRTPVTFLSMNVASLPLQQPGYHIMPCHTTFTPRVFPQRALHKLPPLPSPPLRVSLRNLPPPISQRTHHWQYRVIAHAPPRVPFNGTNAGAQGEVGYIQKLLRSNQRLAARHGMYSSMYVWYKQHGTVC